MNIFAMSGSRQRGSARKLMKQFGNVLTMRAEKAFFRRFLLVPKKE